MKSIIVGGNFNSEIGVKKESSVINKLADILDSIPFNGGRVSDIEHIATNLKEFDLVLWMPNLSNDIEKIYPKKATGSVLICSKVLRENRDFDDAVSRVFKMNANAVITIETTENPFKFTLMDALGNIWVTTTNLSELGEKIRDLYLWTKDSIRVESKKIEFTNEELIQTDLDRLCNLVKTVADRVEEERGGRYFGNVSTRCGKMFPSYRLEHDIVIMSARNVPKSRITPEDFVHTKLVDGKVLFHGDNKPSVDAPIQLNLYKKFEKINFFIHGHAYIENAIYTNDYCPCGDLREVKEVSTKIDPNVNFFRLNLSNHGFLIGADTIDKLEEIINLSDFKHRKVGIERVDDFNYVKHV